MRIGIKIKEEAMRSQIQKCIYIVLFFIFYPDLAERSFSQCNCDHVIGAGEEYVNGINVAPGEVVCLMAGVKPRLGLINFHGTEGNPITIINCGGQVVVENDGIWYYAIRIENSSHFRLSGTGSTAHNYGIKIIGSGNEGSGLTIGTKSTNYEIDHIEIQDTDFAGIMSKTDPDCSGGPNRGNFVQYNTRIHDNYIHDTGGEGIYVGFPHYRGIKKVCDGDSIRLYPHDLHGVRIYNNITERTGREGIQVGCAVADVEIYNNSVRHFGEKNVQWQRAGIHLSTGTTGKLYNNFIKDGRGPGLWLNGHGDNYVFNNILVDVGKSAEHGILGDDSLVVNGTGYYIINNTIIRPGKNGMHFNNAFNSWNNVFYNNIVTEPGSEYVKVYNPEAWKEAGNIFTLSEEELAFENAAAENYRLREESPAVDAGINVRSYQVMFDFYRSVRPVGESWDVGAIESPFEKTYDDFIVYPSPNTGQATVFFVHHEDGPVSLRIYDTRGVMVEELIPEENLEARMYTMDFNATLLRAGVYYCRLERNSSVAVKKVIVLR